MPYSITILIILTILQVLDVITTYKCLQRPDRYELNPVMAWFQAKLGLLPGVIIPKIVALIVSGCLLIMIPHPLMWGVMGLMCVGYAVLVWNNYRQL